jgi:hypothetical protein
MTLKLPPRRQQQALSHPSSSHRSRWLDLLRGRQSWQTTTKHAPIDGHPAATRNAPLPVLPIG